MSKLDLNNGQLFKLISRSYVNNSALKAVNINHMKAEEFFTSTIDRLRILSEVADSAMKDVEIFKKTGLGKGKKSRKALVVVFSDVYRLYCELSQKHKKPSGTGIPLVRTQLDIHFQNILKWTLNAANIKISYKVDKLIPELRTHLNM